MIEKEENKQKALEQIQWACPMCVFMAKEKDKVEGHVLIKHTDKDVKDFMEMDVGYRQQVGMDEKTEHQQENMSLLQREFERKN
jgi:hypothetical protein